MNNIATPITPKPISVTRPVTGTLGGTFNETINLLLSNWLWIAVIVGSIFGVVLFLYMIKKLKKFDPFQVDFQIKKNQCKMFRKGGIKKVFIENHRDGLVPMGMYEGECVDKEGYHNIMFSRFKLGLVGRWLRRIFFFTRPILDLILKKYWIVRCNVNPSYIDKTADIKKGKGQKQKVTTLQLPVPNITSGGGSLIIHCMGLQLKKYFTYPILADSEGAMIQDETINFERERDSVLTNTLYEQTIDFANVMREAINLNPTLRYVIKTEGRQMPEGGG